MVGRRVLGDFARDGIELNNPFVYGCPGCLNNSVTPAFSAILPAYMTTTSSQFSAITPRSWVIKIIDMPDFD
jgi:hypothetical protein